MEHRRRLDPRLAEGGQRPFGDVGLESLLVAHVEDVGIGPQADGG